MIADTFAVAASTFKIPLHPHDKYTIKMKHRPAIPDNIKYWQVFENDVHIETFLTLSVAIKIWLFMRSEKMIKLLTNM